MKSIGKDDAIFGPHVNQFTRSKTERNGTKRNVKYENRLKYVELHRDCRDRFDKYVNGRFVITLAATATATAAVAVTVTVASSAFVRLYILARL